MKKIYMSLTLMLIFVFMNVSADEGGKYSWYFKPAKDGSQPEVIPEAAEFIDDYNTIYLGDKDKKRIYLTFDAGYENGNVEKTLDILNEKNVPGAFFVLPRLSESNSELLKRMKNEGHLVCNHTKTHRDMSKVTDYEVFEGELSESEKIFYDATGFVMDKYYRPPEGRFSEENLKWAQELGYTTVFWSLAYADWDNGKQMDPDKALELLQSRTHNGCVVLLHPTSDTNARIIGEYIDIMRAKGYEFYSLNDFGKSDLT